MKVIWNITRICSWHCLICCVAAIDTKKNEFEQLHSHLVDSDQELSIKEKEAVLNNLLSTNVSSIDFSGGDLLLDHDNLRLIKTAGSILGRENISISIPGNGLTEQIVMDLTPYVSKMEFTLDSLEFDLDGSRPCGYVETAKHAIKLCSKMNMEICVSTILKESNGKISNLKSIYDFLLTNNVKEWEILKYYQVGRAQNLYSLNPSAHTFERAINYINELMDKGNISISYQHSLQNQLSDTVNCNAVTKSIGILPNGLVLACAWGLNACGEPLADNVVLGKMPEQTLADILVGEKAKSWIHNKFCGNKPVCQIQKMLNLFQRDSTLDPV